jgi:hypothetical protein
VGESVSWLLVCSLAFLDLLIVRQLVVKFRVLTNLPHACYMPHPHRPWYDHRNIRRRDEVMPLTVFHFSRPNSYRLPLGSNMSCKVFCTAFKENVLLARHKKSPGTGLIVNDHAVLFRKTCFHPCAAPCENVGHCTAGDCLNRGLRELARGNTVKVLVRMIAIKRYVEHFGLYRAILFSQRKIRRCACRSVDTGPIHRFYFLGNFHSCGLTEMVQDNILTTWHPIALCRPSNVIITSDVIWASWNISLKVTGIYALKEKCIKDAVVGADYKYIGLYLSLNKM